MFNLFQSVNFSQASFLYIGLLPFLLMAISQLFSGISANRYCDKKLQAWVVTHSKKSIYDKLYIKIITPILAWLLLSIALAGPRINIEQRSLDNKIKFNNAMVFVLDISKSMLAQDVYPNRISKAKLVIDKILANTNNYLTSLIVYANNAHIAVPLTNDPNVTLSILKSIKPNMLPVEGSQYSSAIKLAKNILDKSDASNKLIILLSDGDFTLDDDNKKIKTPHIKTHTIGIGTLEGQAIPDKDGGWLSFKNKPVISQLNKLNLKKIADASDGQYIQIKDDITFEIIKRIIPIQRNNASTQSTKSIIVWQQIYHWFLFPALLFFMLSTLRLKRAADKKISQHKQSSIKSTIIPGIFLLILSSISTPSESFAGVLEDANHSYLQNNYIKSERLYRKLTGYHALMGQANSVYKQKNYSKALNLYAQTIKEAITDNERATALFNLANTYYIIGNYEQAISIYKDALRYNSGLSKATINLEYAIIINEKVKRAIALRMGKKMQPKNAKVKPGSGPRSAKIEEGTDVGNSKVTLSNDDDNKQQIYDLNIPQEAMNKLIQRGIKHSVISSSKIDSNQSNSQWKYEYTTLDMIEILVKQEKPDDFMLWKRLFEIEEGFPAPVETPIIKQGVKPW